MRPMILTVNDFRTKIIGGDWFEIYFHHIELDLLHFYKEKKIKLDY